MLNETSATLILQRPAAAGRGGAQAGVVVPDPEVLRAAGDVPNATSVRLENGQAIVTTYGGGQIVVSRSTADGHIILTPARARSTTTTTATTGRTVSPAEFMPPKYVVDGAVTAVSMICGTIFLAPILRYMLRRRERSQQRTPAVAVDPQLHARLDRMEQAIDAIAIEVERSAEAQRYSARLLTERMPEPVVAMSATGESLAVPRRGTHPRE
jgi:hypothetical protein